MNRILTIFIIYLLLLTTCAMAQQGAEYTWARYKPGKLRLIVKAHSVPADSRDKGMDLGSDPVRAQVTHTGASRTTVPAKQRFIAFYMESIGRPEAAKSFMTEMLFIENGVEFWLPVQNVLLPYLRKELRKGESVTVFADWIGITYPRQGGKRTHVFLVNEFEKSESSQVARPVIKQWGTLTGPDGDFQIEFPVEPKHEEFFNDRVGQTGSVARRYYARTDTLMLSISFQALGLPSNNQSANTLPTTYELKVRDAAMRVGWKIIGIRRLSNSVAEVEEWERVDGSEGYAHSISRTIVRNGQVYDLNCRSLFAEQEVDRQVCRRFFNSFHIIGPPR
jgi:hypothetical protein